MKKYISIILTIVTVSIFCKAQSYQVNYQMTYKPDSMNDEMIIKDMILVVKDDISKFYSYNLYKIDSAVDSKNQKKAVDYDFMVVRNKSSRKIEKYFIVGLDMYSLEENFPKLNWKIGQETKLINKINCQKAFLEYKGRSWEAWFAKEIDFQEGPFIFNSLPGLIIEMRDLKNNFNFKMVGIKKDNGIIKSEMGSISVNRDQLVKLYKDFYNDPYKELKTGKVLRKIVDESGREIKPNYNQMTDLKQKEINKKNNPIELSEAINYSE